MGAGKTTLAGALARRWDRPLRDSDVDLDARFGLTAAQLAAERGGRTGCTISRRTSSPTRSRPSRPR